MQHVARHTRWAVFAGIVLLAAAVAGVAWYARDSRSEDEPAEVVEPGRYIEGVAGTWQKLNPIFATTPVDQDLSQLIFSGLLRLGPDGNVEPDLAEALPELGADGRSYTFRIRDDARWQDGAAVTSLDVAYTIARIQDPGFRGDPALAEAWSTVEVETPGQQTVVLRLPQPSAPFLARYGTVGILPEHILRNIEGSALFDAPFNTAPVGTGPYRLVSLTTQEAVLEANADYHLGAPNMPIVVLRFYPDGNAAQRDLAAGELDGLYVRDPASPADLEELAESEGLRASQLQRTSYLVLYLNNDQAAFFLEPEARRAINLALDRSEIVDEALGGLATPSSLPIAPGSWAYAPEKDIVRERLDEARAILADAGWVTNAGTGVLTTREGQEFRFTIRTDTDPGRVAVAGAIAAQLEPLGMRVSVASTSFSVLRRDFLEPRRYDAALATWDQGPDPDPYFGWHSSQLGAAGLNIANFSDIITDEIVGRARQDNDMTVRQDRYNQFLDRWVEIQPSVVIAYQRDVYFQREDIEGRETGLLATPSQRFADIHEWRGAE